MNGGNNSGIKERVTIYVVAQAADVSLATVSRVINHRPNVTKETREKVEAAIARLGYRPSALAQGLARSKTTNIGILMPDNFYVYTSNMLNGMVKVAKTYGYQTDLFVTGPNQSDAIKTIEKLISSHVDGAVIYDDQLSTDEIMTIQNYKIPLIIIGHEMKGNALGSIVMDYKTALISYLTKHFNENTAEDIVFLKSEGDGILMEDLRESVANFCKDKNMKFSTLDIIDSYSRLYEEKMGEFIEQNGKKGHFFIAARDSLAAAICNYCTDNGISVPEDNEVMSIIGTKYSSICRPQISSMDLDMAWVGQIAMRMVTKLLGDGFAEENKVWRFSTKVIERNSTKKNSSK